MAVTADTLARVQRLRDAVGTEADTAVRALTTAWVTGWDGLAARWRTALGDVLALQAELQRWPSPWQLTRLERVQRAMQATEQTLADLAAQAGTAIDAAAGNAADATADREPHILASQLPPAAIGAAAAVFAANVSVGSLTVDRRRTTRQIAQRTVTLATTGRDAVQRRLIGGGAPTVDGLLAGVEGGFHSALGSAVDTARVETVDAYRATARLVHAANSDVLAGWSWHCRCALTSCFPAGTSISTPHGRVPIEQVRIGDEVLTHTGKSRRVSETMVRAYSGGFVTVIAGDSEVTATDEHPFLVERQGQLSWMPAREVHAGDIVFSDRQRQSHVINHGAGERTVKRRSDKPYDEVPPGLQERSLFGVSVGDPVMPVRLVDFQGNAHACQDEIHRALPASDRFLLNELDAELVKSQSDVSLRNGFATVAPVATNRAEPAIALHWHNAERFVASKAKNHDRRPVARFGAMLPAPALVGKDLPASLARAIRASAANRTVSVVMGSAGRDDEFLAARGAGFLNSLLYPETRDGAVRTGEGGVSLEGNATLGARGGNRRPSGLPAPSVWAAPLEGRIARRAAELSAPTRASSAGRVAEDITANETSGLVASFAVSDSLLRTDASPGTKLPLSAGRRFENDSAMLASPLHRSMVSEVSTHLQASFVYNLEVDGDHSYIANGLAVHNCASCWAMDGTEYPADDEGPLDHVGGQCMRLPILRSWRRLGYTEDGPPSVIQPARDRFDGLPEADQVAVLGAARHELLTSGAVEWSDLATRRDNRNWRTSYVPTPVRDLQRIARHRSAA